jgi:hypothetical protein
VVGLVLRAVDVAGRWRWRWLLVDAETGAALADHQVDVDPHAVEAAAFDDLYRHLRWQAEPDRRLASEAELVARVGAWAGSAVLGERVGAAIVAAAGAGPVVVRVAVPAGAEFRQAQTLDRAVPAAVAVAAGPAPTAGRPALSVGTPALFGASALGLSLAPPVGPPVLDAADTPMAGFPPEPPRFVGRAGAMAAATAVLASESGRTGVVFHGMAGAGKTACALELAYRHERVFEAHAFWSATTDPDQFGDALRLLAMTLEAQLADYGFAMVDKIGTLATLEAFLPRLRALLREHGLLLVLDNLETLLTRTASGATRGGHPWSRR